MKLNGFEIPEALPLIMLTTQLSVAPQPISMAAQNDSQSSVSEWTIIKDTVIRYFTRIFNQRTGCGYITGTQARNILVQSKLPHLTLAKIWELSDRDRDGKLGYVEFVLAMHLCDIAINGQEIPKELPPDLVPSSFRKTTSRAVSTQTSRHGSVSFQGGGVGDIDPLAGLPQTSFEDKRKETLMNIQRKTQLEQKETARKEMERQQRQLEWEKQKIQEMEQQRQREQDQLLRLKALNQNSFNLIKELSQKIVETRNNVTNLKAVIDRTQKLFNNKQAQNDDELSFEKDDIISVVGRDESEWWRGELNGIQGLFPSNYVGPFVSSGKF
ncbi:hypothetical protein DMENIID0001_144500 [Sergentomyia squamirostris]